jgi:thiol-disulfide isomerase/thioredoxin
MEALRVLEESPLFIIEFWLPTCPPCLRLKPLLVEFTAETGIPVVTVNLKEKTFDELSDRYGVKDTPTLVVIREGQEVARGIPSTKIGLLRLAGRAVARG